MPLVVYVGGVGGLGNTLFQIASAIHYTETFGGTISLQKTKVLMYGTSEYLLQNLQINGKTVPYTDTIFRNFKLCDGFENEILVHNNYTDNKYVPKDGRNILIGGYCQNINLFIKVLDRIPKYLNFEDRTIRDHVESKYKNISEGILISLRVGRDFRYMERITRNSYINALKKLQSMDINIDNLFIVSDVPNAWTDKLDLQNVYPATFINENDIVQMYAGLMCKHYVLCESTFHLWIAYLGTINSNDKKVIVFKNTDLTNRPLSLDSWIQVDY